MKLINLRTYKKQIISATFLAVLLTTNSSCKKDFLEAVPETSISDATAFDTPERILTQVNGLYSSLKSGDVDPDGNVLAFLSGRYQIFSDIRAEEFVNQTTNVVTGYNVYNNSFGADDSYLGNIWTVAYRTINRTNLFLKGIDENADKLDAALATQYKGEAKFVRALAYFYLVQGFAKPYSIDKGASPGLPLRLQAETTAENNGLKRSTVAEVYAQILKDLNEAESELAADNGSTVDNTIRAQKNTAIALKTRVYLVMGDYQNVIVEANKIVSASAPFVATNNVNYSLAPDIASVFVTPFTSSESIFSLGMSSTNTPGTQNELGSYFNYGGGASFEYSINTKTPGIFSNAQFAATDQRKTKLTGVNPDGFVYLKKYSNVSPFTDYVPVIRYSEVLLNLAEAEARVGNQARALALVSFVHNRSDAAYSFGTLNQAQLITAILTERRIELIGEGFRTLDLLRLGQAIPSVGAGASVSPSSPDYIYPIPVEEIQNNPDINK